MIFGRGKPKNDDDDATAVEKKKKKQDTYLPGKKISVNTRSKWGMNDEDEEYDLEMALDNSTDPFITKVVAGSLIVSIFTLLIVAIIIPATTDYGEGVCQPLLNGGRCWRNERTTGKQYTCCKALQWNVHTTITTRPQQPQRKEKKWFVLLQFNFI